MIASKIWILLFASACFDSNSSLLCVSIQQTDGLLSSLSRVGHGHLFVLGVLCLVPLCLWSNREQATHRQLVPKVSGIQRCTQERGPSPFGAGHWGPSSLSQKAAVRKGGKKNESFGVACFRHPFLHCSDSETLMMVGHHHVTSLTRHKRKLGGTF